MFRAIIYNEMSKNRVLLLIFVLLRCVLLNAKDAKREKSGVWYAKGQIVTWRGKFVTHIDRVL